jgi:hypothetical protein
MARSALFEKANIFKDFILYGIKRESNRNDPMYLISKLVLNRPRLRRRRGSAPVIISDNELIKYVEKIYLISEIINLGGAKPRRLILYRY